MAGQVKEKGFGGMQVADISGDYPHPLMSLTVTIGQILRPAIDYGKK
jgi:hypothetical protein